MELFKETVTIKGEKFPKDFIEYIGANFHLYELFRDYARQIKAQGFKRYSQRTIIERIRWETDIKTTPAKPFKICNNHVRSMARLLVLEDNSFEGFFKFHRR